MIIIWKDLKADIKEINETLKEIEDALNKNEDLPLNDLKRIKALGL